MRIQSYRVKLVSIVASIALALSGAFAAGSVSFASTAANPTIFYDGNSLATVVPVSETAARTSNDSLVLSSVPLTRTATTSRTGYSFGGWSLVAGAAPAVSVTTNTLTDTSRTLFAVWNTSIKLERNGAESGTPSGGLESINYRFGQTLPLPTAGTMTRQGFSFGGWMSAPASQSRFSTYTAGINDPGNPTFYAAWIKTVSFNANGATSGTIPDAMTYLAGGSGLNLPGINQMTLRKAGHYFGGWSTSPTGRSVINSAAYIPISAERTLYAIWKLETTAATSRVFFKPGSINLRAKQKLALRDLADSLEGRGSIAVSLTSERAKGSRASLGRNRAIAVVRYLESIGVEASFSTTNSLGIGRNPSAKKNNRVTISASWTNPN